MPNGEPRETVQHKWPVPTQTGADNPPHPPTNCPSPPRPHPGAQRRGGAEDDGKTGWVPVPIALAVARHRHCSSSSRSLSRSSSIPILVPIVAVPAGHCHPLGWPLPSAVSRSLSVQDKMACPKPLLVTGDWTMIETTIGTKMKNDKDRDDDRDNEDTNRLSPTAL